jgi:hypothetical protein
MAELHGVYQRSLGEKEGFLSRIIPLVLADARFATWRDRLVYTRYWRTEFEEMQLHFKDPLFVRCCRPTLCSFRREGSGYENRPEVSKMQGEDALQLSVRAVLARTESILKSLPAVVEANGVDALLIDTVQFYAELGAMQLGMPYIHVSGALHFDYSGHTPLCLYGWPHQTTPAALARNREGVARFVKVLEAKLESALVPT